MREQIAYGALVQHDSVTDDAAGEGAAARTAAIFDLDVHRALTDGSAHATEPTQERRRNDEQVLP